MNWIIKMIRPEHRAYDGVLIEHKETEYEIPFELHSDVYYVHRKKWWKRNSPYVITKCIVTGVWATNMIGVILNNTNHVGENEFDHIFVNREEAIEYCLKMNERRKVKIYGE
jgi:hypothetical protein